MNTPSNLKCRVSRAQGFTLLEVLIALFVLSFGLLGVGALQGQGLRSSGDALFRTHALVLAGDIADHMRANTEGFGDYDSDGDGTLVSYTDTAADHSCIDTGANASACTSGQMAEQAVNLWKTTLASALPSGQGQLTVNTGTNPPTYTIWIQWSQINEVNPMVYSLTVQM